MSWPSSAPSRASSRSSRSPGSPRCSRCTEPWRTWPLGLSRPVGEVVELEIPARPEYLALARLLVPLRRQRPAVPRGPPRRPAPRRVRGLHERDGGPGQRPGPGATNGRSVRAHPDPLPARRRAGRGRGDRPRRGLRPRRPLEHPPVTDPSRLDYERGLGIPLIRILTDEVEFGPRRAAPPCGWCCTPPPPVCPGLRDPTADPWRWPRAVLLLVAACRGRRRRASGEPTVTGATASPQRLGATGPLADVKVYSGLTRTTSRDRSPTARRRRSAATTIRPGDLRRLREPVPSRNAVHSMEHGAVWITYRPSLPDASRRRSRLVAGHPFLLVSPWTDDKLPSPIVLPAWGLQLGVDSASIRPWPPSSTPSSRVHRPQSRASVGGVGSPVATAGG